MRDSSIVDLKDIKFACSHCGQHIVVERSAAGLNGTCPVCHNPVVVPQPDGAGEEIRLTEKARHESTRDDARWQRMDLEEARMEIVRQHNLFKKAVEECERLNANATHIQAESKRFQADRQLLKADLAQARQAASAGEARAAEVGAALIAAQHENNELRARIENELAVLHERLGATATQLDLRETELQESRSENSQVVQALAQGQAELAALDAEVVGLRKDLASYRQDAETTAQHLASTAQQLKETQGHLETTSESLRQSNHERDDWRHQAETLRSDLSSIDSGRELLDLREKFGSLEQTCKSAETALAARTEEAARSASAVETLRAELKESRRLHAEAERRADANSESQMKKDNEVLRGIVDRQNSTLAVQHADLRQMRRARFGVRLVYALLFLGLLALAILALMVLNPQDFAKYLPH
jgi:chromosome segregation ATPase